jgi:hypothetical protein
LANPLNMQAYPAKNPGWIGPVFAKSAVSAAVSSGLGPIGPLPLVQFEPAGDSEHGGAARQPKPVSEGFA